jgi:hypothetical protein
VAAATDLVGLNVPAFSARRRCARGLRRSGAAGAAYRPASATSIRGRRSGDQAGFRRRLFISASGAAPERAIDGMSLMLTLIALQTLKLGHR